MISRQNVYGSEGGGSGLMEGNVNSRKNVNHKSGTAKILHLVKNFQIHLQICSLQY